MSTFGEALRRERELRRITLREVSEATKINLRYLEALERNDFEHLPGGVFNKGFVRAYAEFIGADPEGMVNAYLLEQRQQQHRQEQTPSATERLSTPAEPPLAAPSPSATGEPGATRRWVGLVGALIALALLAGGVGWKLLRESGSSPPAESAPTAALPEEEGGAVADDAVPDPVPSRASAVPEPEADDTPEQPEPEPKPPEAASADRESPAPVPDSGAPEGTIRARLILERATSGRLNCDNRRVEVLDGLPAGTTLTMECRRFLLIDADDAGGIRMGLGGAAPTALGANGVPLRGYRVVPQRLAETRS